MNQHAPMPLPGQQPPVQDPDPFAPPPPVDDPGAPPLPPYIATKRGEDARDRAGSQALLNAAFSFGLFAMPLPETWLVAWLGYEGTLLVLAAVGLTTTGILLCRLRRPTGVHSGFN